MAVTVIASNKAAEYMGDATIDLDGDTFKMQLHSALTYNAATMTVAADVSGTQLSTANGYTSGGATIGSVTWVESSGTVTLDSADISWTASGGSIAATDAVMIDDTPTSPADPIVLNIDFGQTETAGDGTDFIIVAPTGGWWASAFS